jgi:hypothetical protein
MAAKKRLEAVLARDTLAARIFGKWSGSAEVALERLESELEDVSRYEIVASLKLLEKAGAGRLIVGKKGQKSRFSWTEAQPPPDARHRVTGRLMLPPARVVSARVSPTRRVSKPSVAARRLTRPVGPGAAETKTALREAAPAAADLDTLARAVRKRLPLAADAATDTPRLLTHSFHLRASVLVTFELPEDITASEIERLCQLLQAIPFR